MKLSSPAFQSDATIPSQYTCAGEGISPPLAIAAVPNGTTSLVLIMDDPDAPGARPFVHWLAWNIDPTMTTIEEGSEPNGILGLTDYGTVGFGPPCPPDRQHRYVFTLYALDTLLTLPEGSTKEHLLAAMQGHILDQTELVGSVAPKEAKQ